MKRLLFLGLVLAALLGILVLLGYVRGQATVALFREYALEPVFKVTSPKPVRYDVLSQALTISRDIVTGGSAAIKETDLYHRLEYEFFIPTDVSVSETKTNVSNRYISGFTLSPADGGIKITAHERSVTAFIITETEENIYIKPVHPRERYDKILLLDAGHGGHDDGAVSQAGIVEWNGENRLVEKDYNLMLTHRVAGLLEQNPEIKVYLSRTEDVFISLTDRRELRDYLADVFVSLHVNASEYPAKNGLWTYYCDNTGTDDYSGRMFALDMLYTVAKPTGYAGYDIDQANFAVLRGAKVPATLVEVGFLTNEGDLRRLATDAFADKLAQGVYAGILEGFEHIKR